MIFHLKSENGFHFTFRQSLITWSWISMSMGSYIKDVRKRGERVLSRSEHLRTWGNRRGFKQKCTSIFGSNLTFVFNFKFKLNSGNMLAITQVNWGNSIQCQEQFTGTESLEIQNRITLTTVWTWNVPQINMTAIKIFTYHSYWMSLQQKFYCEIRTKYQKMKNRTKCHRIR